MATRKPVRKPTAARGGASSVSGKPGLPVRIRMYRQGIGDAFLLSIGPRGEQRHMLIDCGVLLGSPQAPTWARRIARNVREVTDGRLDVLVATHAHWDHVSGFLQAREVFEQQMTVGEVWMGWTENKEDAQAARSRKRIALQAQALYRAAAQLRASPLAASQGQADAISHVLSFLGPPEGYLQAAGGGGTQAAMDVVRGLSDRVIYREPGERFAFPGVDDLTIHVLGPPRDEAMLGQMLGRKGKDMYELGPYAGFAAALERFASEASSDDGAAVCEPVVDPLLPFDRRMLFTAEQAAHIAQDAGFGPQAAAGRQAMAEVLALYDDPACDWRRIDDSWLLSAEALALNLDNYVNNTSLVLALELPDGRVLLFAADAQVGNWKSWSGLSWSATGGGASAPKVSSADLLARTVFYKVGHHGSHNATLKEGGLDAMTHRDLVAAIPVNQQFANDKKDWDMPAPGLYQALREKTRGRILRADGEGPTATREPSGRGDGEWASFAARVHAAPADAEGASLYVDYVID